MVVERVRFCEPLPQLMVQVDHEDQALWAQWTLMFECKLDATTWPPEQLTVPPHVPLLHTRYA